MVSGRPRGDIGCGWLADHPACGRSLRERAATNLTALQSIDAGAAVGSRISHCEMITRTRVLFWRGKSRGGGCSRDWRGWLGKVVLGENRMEVGCLRWKKPGKAEGGGERSEVSLCAWAGGTDVVSYFFFTLLLFSS